MAVGWLITVSSSHFFITILVDIAIAVPGEFLFSFQRAAGEYHVRENKDLLFASRPVWLQSVVWIELLFQTPFFLVAANGLWKGILLIVTMNNLILISRF
jgi:hypothetical protein